MKQTVSLNTFRDAFQAIRPDNFSYEGLEVLFDHLEELESDTGEEMELDVIAICCDYTEDTLGSALQDNNCEDLDDLERCTTVIMVDEQTDDDGELDKETTRIIYQNY